MDNAKKEKCRIALGMISRLCENTKEFIRLSELEGDYDMLSALKIANYAKSGIDMIVSEVFGNDAISDKHLVENALSTQAVKKSVIKYESVDLGLPSGLKWADRNVGAEKTEAFGDYFMWGSTEPDTDKPCDWAHAPFNCDLTAFDGTYFKSVKDCVCPGGVLASEYDAAHVNMGGSWRMPTKDEMQELIEGTAQSLGTLNGVKGMRFTSKANGNSIFIPFAGYRYDSYVNYVGYYGDVWSSSLDAISARCSKHLGFDYFGDTNVRSYNRFVGFVVRGVHE